MKLHSKRINQRVIKTRLEEAEWQKLLIDAVAKQAGEKPTSARAYVSTRDTSFGIQKDVEVEIIVDYSGAPSPEDA